MRSYFIITAGPGIITQAKTHLKDETKSLSGEFKKHSNLLINLRVTSNGLKDGLGQGPDVFVRRHLLDLVQDGDAAVGDGQLRRSVLDGEAGEGSEDEPERRLRHELFPLLVV